MWFCRPWNSSMDEDTKCHTLDYMYPWIYICPGKQHPVRYNMKQTHLFPPIRVPTLSYIMILLFPFIPNLLCVPKSIILTDYEFYQMMFSQQAFSSHEVFTCSIIIGSGFKHWDEKEHLFWYFFPAPYVCFPSFPLLRWLTPKEL